MNFTKLKKLQAWNNCVILIGRKTESCIFISHNYYDISGPHGDLKA